VAKEDGIYAGRKWIGQEIADPREDPIAESVSRPPSIRIELPLM